MNRHAIICLIGEKHYTDNIEGGEWSYSKALCRPIKGHQFLDIRFVKNKFSILVETKQFFTTKDEQQLFDYIKLEKELTGNNTIGILANTKNNDIKVWKDDELLPNEKKLKTMDEYIDLFSVKNTNNKEQVMQATYKLNELLHKNDIDEDIRSQFVGTCLLALKNNSFAYSGGLQTSQIIAGIDGVLQALLKTDNSGQKDIKIRILSDNVLKNQKVRELDPKNFISILNYIKAEIMPSIDHDSTAGQDLLNLFFTTFNKYVGKKDKNQAYTPDHIVHFMCKVAEINRNSVVLDPTCGSGAFLVQAMTQAIKECYTEAEKNNVKQRQIFGIEKEEKAFGLSTTNMLIHGDGNSNIINASCFDKTDWIKKARINVVLMNPPYNAKPVNISKAIATTWKKDLKEDPTKGFCFVNYIAENLSNGKLLCLLPLACAIGSDLIIKDQKKKILENNTLEAVFTLPADMFHPGASSPACCMVFTLGQPHDKNKETFFGYYKNDGFVKKKNLGRVDTKNQWEKIEEEWLDLYKNKISKAGISTKQKINHESEWLAEAYMDTDYSILSAKNFENSIKHYLAYLIDSNSINYTNFIAKKLQNENQKQLTNSQNWKSFRVGSLFTIEKGKCNDSTSLDDGDEICYIAAKKTSNGVGRIVKKDEGLITKGNCICFVCQGEGSNGYNNYFGQDTIQTTSNAVGYNKNLNKYNGLFIVSVLDLEKPKFCFGRGRARILADTIIKLPAKGTEPDWKYMEDYIKSLPYGDLI